jgi:integrase
MRIRECYSLYKRRVPSGKVVYYYRTYDENGKRFCGHSTGQSTKTAANEYCKILIREKRLTPIKRGKALTFEEFAAGWWDYETCPYLQSRKERRPISRGYATQGQYAVRNHLIPAFGKKRIDAITENDIDAWLTAFRQGTYTLADKTTQANYKGNTANLVFKILKIMLNFAAKKGLIRTNPCKHIEMVSTDDEKVIQILTPEEEKKLFPADWERIWDLPQFYVLNRLASISGMRHGELLGLRGEFVHETYIDVCAQYTRFGYQDVKTHKPKNIPIPQKMHDELQMLVEMNGGGYLFSRDGGKRPIHRNYVYKALYQALDRIGINEEERKRRNLSMHGWRHFFSTELEMADIPDSRAREVTGHSSKKTRRRYNHLDNLRMLDVIQLQEKLMEPKAEDSDTAAATFQAAQERAPDIKKEKAGKDRPGPAIKRGRGRPRKAPEPEAKPAAQRGRGRPKKAPEAAPGNKRGWGRPQKTVAPEAARMTKRGRGRPGKKAVEA